MPDLIAQGPASGDRWRREIPSVLSRQSVTLGRSDADWMVPWDAMISRRHVRVTPKPDGRIEVERFESARNPVYHFGRQTSRFTLVPGEHFVIGKTTFTLANRPGVFEPQSDHGVTEHAFDQERLSRRSFTDAASRIHMLSKLPDLITGSSTDQEMLVRVSGVLLQATASASAVAIVRSDRDSAIDVMHYDTRDIDATTTAPAVSAKLVRSAVEKHDSVLHLWSEDIDSQPPPEDGAGFTANENVDWAFCVPLRSQACPGWALYVTGKMASIGAVSRGPNAETRAPGELEDDIKFAELVGTMVGNVRQGRRLERRQAAIRHFFAPIVMDALAGRDTETVLVPRETDLSVLFCDLRGFSRQSEEGAGNLLPLLERVSEALGVMTKHILESGGVIGDFHGDAAMGFWGWPLDQDDMESRAAEAAIRIWDSYREHSSGLQFSCGIGIASGPAVAGRIGTTDQVKVTAFGPVVNLASRLEGMTKQFGIEIIIDESTAERLKTTNSFQEDLIRIRQLATVRPAGMRVPVRIFQLTVPTSGPTQTLSIDQIRLYESALADLTDGDWEAAYCQLQELPAADRPKDVMLELILRNGRKPPSDWSGVIDLPKS